MKLEDILKARGWTDEDLKANETLLNNPKFRMSLEEEYNAVASQRDKFKTDFENEQTKWTKWHTEEAIPIIDQYSKDRADAVAEAAALRARLALAEKAGFLAGGTPPAGDPAGTPPAGTPPAANLPFDPKAAKVVTYDDLNTFANGESRAMAMYHDISEEYRILTGGGSLGEYSWQTPDGRTLRGITALQAERAQLGRTAPAFDQFVSQKFDFAGKRKAIDDKRKADAEAAIRADERSKVAAEYGNPAARPPATSLFRTPFKPRDANEKQPWELGLTDQQMRERRLSKAMETEMKSRIH